MKSHPRRTSKCTRTNTQAVVALRLGMFAFAALSWAATAPLVGGCSDQAGSNSSATSTEVEEEPGEDLVPGQGGQDAAADPDSASTDAEPEADGPEDTSEDDAVDPTEQEDAREPDATEEGTPDATDDEEVVEEEPDDVDMDDEDSMEPGGPNFPSTIKRLSFAIETGNQSNDGSNAEFEVCLNGQRCFPLDVPAVDDFRRGDFDVFHFSAVDLPRSEVDRVELRHIGGGDMWHPVCIEARFDGEPVHCTKGLPRLGNGGAQEVRRHREDLRNDCNTCYSSRVTHGPLVGAVGPRSARVMVRMDATREVSLQIARAASPGEVVATAGPSWPRILDDYTTVFDVEGLSPRTRYVATVVIGDHVTNKQATFRTAPRAGQASSFRVAMGSCSNNDTIRAPHPIFDKIAEKNPDLFIFLGDNHYGNTGAVQGLWWNYRDVLSMPPRKRLVSSTPTLAIWDDHDFTGNNSTRHAPGRARALRAFVDYWANPSYGDAEQDGIFSKYSFGDVDIFLLDTRYERDRPNTGGSILGEAQFAWLKRELKASSARFKIIASGSLVSQNGGETWRDYATRDELFQFIRNQDIEGVLAISGDIHRSELRRIKRAHYDMPEIVASGLANVSNSTCRTPPGEVNRAACAGGTGSFAVLDVDTTRNDPRIIARLFDKDGAAKGTMTILASQLRAQ